MGYDIMTRESVAYYKNLVFYTTFIAYAMSHFSRKSYTNVKAQLKEDNMDPILLSRMDTTFMFCYAIGSFFSGNIGDTYHAPTVVGVGLVGSGMCVAVLVAGIWADIPHASAALSQTFFMGVWLIHGLLQSVGGPVGTSIMGNWFSARNRGYVFGTWTCHQYIGNILAAVVSSFIISTLEWHWTFSLVISAACAIIWGVWCVYALPECPEDVYGIVEGGRMHNLELLGHEQRTLLSRSASRESSGAAGKVSAIASNVKGPGGAGSADETTGLLKDPMSIDVSDSPSGKSTPIHVLTSRHLPPTTTTAHLVLPPTGGAQAIAPITFAGALRIPNVVGYAMAFGFFKLVNYAMFFWLPYFLAQHYSPAQSNLISVLYDVGMMPGGIIVGAVSDLLGGRRACVIAVFMVFLAPLLVLFALYAETMQPVALLLMLGVMGILIGGPNNIITSAVAADLADHPSVKNNAKALGTVTGIINGSGSVIAALGLLVIGPLQLAYGWNSVWYFLVVCVLVGTLLMTPKVMKELFQHHSLEPDATLPIRGSSIGTVGVPIQSSARSGESSSTMVELGRGTMSTNGADGSSYQAIPGNNYSSLR